MSDIQGPARLGSSPELRYPLVNGEQKPVCEFKAIFLNYKRNKESTGDDDKYIDKGFWVRVTVWGSFAEKVCSLFSVGDKVFIADGDIDQDSFKPKNATNDDERVHVFNVSCNMVFPWVPDLDSFSYLPRKKAD